MSEQERGEHTGVQVKYQLGREDYKRMRSVRIRLGFGSDYEFSAACVRLMVRTLEQASKDREEEEVCDMHREIGGLFASLAEAEAVELGRVERADRSRLLSLLYPEEKGTEQASHTNATPEPATLRNRIWANSFINKYYQELYRKHREQDQLMGASRSGDPYCDILGNMMLSLYECNEDFGSYADFEDYALDKFKLSSKRKRHRK